jgi:hypothetical protein
MSQSVKEVINYGAIKLIRDEDGSLSCWMKTHEDNQPLTIFSSLPIRVLLTGDLLEYFAAICRKVNMAGNWCTWCGLLAKEWSPTDHDKIKLWTLVEMAEVRMSINLGITNDTLADCQGCIHVPLWTAMPINSHMIPILHSDIGIGNCLLKSFLEWVDRECSR